MQAEKDTALLEDEKVFIKTISLVLELLPPFTISKVGNIIKPTHGFSKKGEIYLSRLRVGILDAGSCTWL